MLYPNTFLDPEKEIKNVVLKLRNGKAFGNDGILNEYIKNTIDDLMPIYVKLFCSFCHRPDLQTVSNAHLKSTKVQYNFFSL
jgi:hypothetical protein